MSTLVIRTLHVLTLKDLTSVLVFIKNSYTGDGNTCNLAAGNNQENWCKFIYSGGNSHIKSDQERMS